jgi:thiol-disulfide isomerase/thioredoxin
MEQYQLPYQYIIDTSALFDLRKNYPERIFPTLWENFNEMCRYKYIVAPREVLREIKKGNDELLEWSDLFQDIFLEPCDEEIPIIQEIMSQYPEHIIEKYSTRPWADPLVISGAKHYNIPIIQHENSDSSQYKIPSVAKNFKIKCIRLVDLFDDQSWKF